VLQLQPGFILNSTFRIESLIGSGGMGDVYAAYDQTLNRKVAIKILTALQDPDDRERFRNEAKALSELRHQGVCSVYKLDTLPNGTPFIVMELVAGESLRLVLRRQRTLPFEEATKLIISLCDALQAVHAFGITHRDIKPENIMISPEGPKLLDFGLCRLPGQQLTQPGLLIGTVQYISPEQGRGLPASENSDIYALGCILFEILTGEKLFDADNPVAMVHRHAFSNPPSLSQHGKCSAELETIVQSCLTKSPEDRCSSAIELGAALQQLLTDGQEHFLLQSDAKESTKRALANPVSKRRTTILTCTLTTLLIAAVFSSTAVMRQMLALQPGPTLESLALSQARLLMSLHNYEDAHKLITTITNSVNHDTIPNRLAKRTATRKQLREIDDAIKTRMPSELDQTLLHDELMDFARSIQVDPDSLETWTPRDFENYNALLVSRTSKSRDVIQENLNRMKDLSSAWHTRVVYSNGKAKELAALHQAHARALEATIPMLPKSDQNFANGVRYHIAVFSQDYDAIVNAAKICMETGESVEKQQVLLEIVGEHARTGHSDRAYEAAKECLKLNTDRADCTMLRAAANLKCAEYAKLNGDIALALKHFREADELSQAIYKPEELDEYRQRRNQTVQALGDAIKNQSQRNPAPPPTQ
jgi:serine/threonine protein kinase